MTFATDNARPATRRRILVAITLSDPEDCRDDNYNTDPGASPVLRFCEAGDGPDGSLTVSSNAYWPFIAEIDGVASSASFGQPGPDGFGTLTLANGRYPFQRKHSGGQVRATGTNVAETDETRVKLTQLFANYIVTGAAITISVAAQAPDSSWTSSQRFTGRITSVRYNESAIYLGFLEDKSQVQARPDAEYPVDAIVVKEGFPNAPEGSIGEMIPIVFSPDTSLRSVEYEYSVACNSQQLTAIWPGVITSALNDHAASEAGTIHWGKWNTTYGNSAYDPLSLIWYPQLGEFAYMGGAAHVCNATEAYTQIAVNGQATIYIKPVVHPASSGGTNVGKMFDGRPDTYAYIDATSILLGTVPDTTPLGKITSLQAYCILAPGTGVDTGSGGSSVNAAFGIYNVTAGAWFDVSTTNGTKLTKDNLDNGGYFESLDYGAARIASLTAPWKWERNNAGTYEELAIGIDGTTALVTVRVICCGYKVTFVPQNLRKETRQKERVPIIGPTGRLEGYRYV